MFFLFFLAGVLPAHAASFKVVAMGDSTTAGASGFRSPLESPPDGWGNPESQYEFWLNKAFPDWEILNRGIGGQRSDQILKRFERDVLQNKPNLVIILAGVNDLHQNREPGWVMDHLTQMYQLAKSNGIRVMACTILPYNEASQGVLRRIETVNEWIREYARREGLLFCDTYRAVEDPVRPGRLSGSPDNIHPDPAAYRRMGEAIAAALKENPPEADL